MVDVVVVGAGCAGAASAMLLARAGHDVLLVERGAFPAPKLSTLYLQPQGVELLRRWGLLPAVVASGCPKLDTITYGAEDVVLHAPAPRFGELDGCYAPKREVLDGLLVEAARAAGARFEDRTKFVGVVTEQDRVRAVRLRGPDGAVRSVPTGLVVGADGMRSAVAASVGAPIQAQDPIKTCVYYGSWLGLDGGFEFHERIGSWVAMIPTNDGETVVAVYFPQAEFPRVRLDPPAALRGAVEQTAPEVARRLAFAQPVGKLKGSGAQENFFRVPAGPGWALIGDAGHHKDSITARGITDGLTQAQLLADALEAGSDGDEDTDRALTGFHRARDEALTAGYEATLSVADLAIPPGRVDMLRTISASPELCTRYFAVVAGLTPMQDLLTADLLALL